MAKVTVQRIGYAGGAHITGVDATKPLDAETIATIRQAWLDHIAVSLPGQDLTPSQLRSFCAQFGELDITENTRVLPRHPEMPEVLMRANKPLGEYGIAQSRAAAEWHSDYPFSLHPASISFLFGMEIPSVGGDTMFANGYMAYETLSPRFQAMLETLWGIHDYRTTPGWKKTWTAEQRDEIERLNPAVVHPVVRVHPETGRKALFIHQWLKQFVGMTEEESKPLLEFLMAHHTRYEFLYRHRWSHKDILIWDNRCSMHIAVQDYAPEMRLMVRCSLTDERRSRTLAEHLGRKPAPAAVT